MRDEPRRSSAQQAAFHVGKVHGKLPSHPAVRATWFFTVALAERNGNRLLTETVDVLRTAFRDVKSRHPFWVDAVALMPDHQHCIWTLPNGDADYSTRWDLIKAGLFRRFKQGERRSASRVKRGERGIWQRRFWEHLIRDERDYARHVDYILRNPLKHGCVSSPAEWPYSSFWCFVKMGLYPPD